MNYSFILVIVLSISLSACGNSKKEDHGHDHAGTECSGHEHNVENMHSSEQKPASQEEFVVDSTEMVKACSSSSCAGCSEACSSIDASQTPPKQNHLKTKTHDHDGQHTHD